MKNDYAYNFLKPKIKGNFILDLNPISKLNILLVMALSGFFVFNYYYGFAISLLYIILAVWSKCFKGFISIYWKIVICFSSLLFIVRAAFTNGEVILFQFAGIHVTNEGIFLGLISAALVTEFSGAFILFMKITDMEDLVYTLEKHGMSHVMSYIILSAFQTIKDLSKSSKMILDSQKCRGIETEGNILQRAKAFIPILGPLVLGAISSAEEKTIAMDARAFSAQKKHTNLIKLKKISISEYVLVIIFDLIFLGIIVWRIFEWIK